MPSNIVTISQQLKTLIQSIDGINYVFRGIPPTLSDKMFYYRQLNVKKLKQANFRNSLKWTFDAWLCIQYSNNEQAEIEMGNLVPVILAINDTHLSVYGSIPDGELRIDGGITKPLTSGSGKFMCQNFTIEAIEHFVVPFAL